MSSSGRDVIGVFDSGVGGLTVVRRIWEHLPFERVCFVADQAHVPYGGRPVTEVAGFASGITAALAGSASAKAVVMACNISTATALDAATRGFPGIPVIGVIAPGAEAAVRASSTGSIGVLATAGTVSTGAYTSALKSLNAAVDVTEVACPDFVPLIEAGRTESDEAHSAACSYLSAILSAGADVVVLGCTHYPFLLPCLQQIAPGILFVDPAGMAACELASSLDRLGTRALEQNRPAHVLYTTGDPDQFERQVELFMPQTACSVTIRQARWDGDILSLPE